MNHIAVPADLPEGTLVELFFRSVDTYRDRPAQLYEDAGGAWQEISHGEMVGAWYDVDETYFIARCNSGTEITVDRWTELEVQTIQECRWWTLEQICADAGKTAVFVPRMLPQLLPGILAGELPSEPLMVDVP